MLREDGAPPVGWVGPRKGWGSLGSGKHVAYRTAAAGEADRELTVGRAIRNERTEQRVLVQPCRGSWQGVRIVNRVEYLTTEGTITVEALDHRRREEIVRYAALVAPVELLTGGELIHSSAPRLESGG